MGNGRYPQNILADVGVQTDRLTLELVWRFRETVRSGIFDEKMYSLFTKYYIEGLSVKETAAALDMSVNQVKRGLKRIIKLLKREMISITPGLLEEEVRYALPEPDEMYGDQVPWEERFVEIDFLTCIDELDISVRSYVALKRAGVGTVEDIEELGIEGLRSIRGLNERCIREITEEVKKRFVVDL